MIDNQYPSPPTSNTTSDLNFSPSVHTPETSIQLDRPSRFREWKARNCKPQLAAAEELYAAVDDYERKRYSERLANCSTSAYFVRHESSGKVRVASSRCKLRWCPICQSAKRYIIAQGVNNFLKPRHFAKFLTLTLQHSDDPLPEQIDRLYNSFRELRRLKFVKKAISGGVWFFQVKFNDSTKQYHPHLHCILTGKFVSQSALSRSWLRITGDSKIVDIRSVKNQKAAAEYVARYASAPCDLSTIGLVQRYDLFKSMHGRRICGSWGIMSKIPLRPVKPPDADKWINIGSYSLVMGLRTSLKAAEQVYSAWVNNSECPYPTELVQVEKDILNCNYSRQPLTDNQMLLDFYDS